MGRAYSGGGHCRRRGLTACAGEFPSAIEKSPVVPWMQGVMDSCAQAESDANAAIVTSADRSHVHVGDQAAAGKGRFVEVAPRRQVDASKSAKGREQRDPGLVAKHNECNAADPTSSASGWRLPEGLLELVAHVRHARRRHAAIGNDLASCHV